ncbi:MAG: hypothetical protein A3E84_02830 [Gammaproteobacteria bacterium RIFCSPHIGHO2_12_FULL_42_13]|nr:MAG: hypothetical protein A3E84_02830 [Gammaproteobacteria bacterium RIFCSPHIGHO2_12_FULL_42_13]
MVHASDLPQGFLIFFSSNAWLTTTGLILLGMLVFHWLSRRIHRLLLAKFDMGKHPWMISFVRSVHTPWLTFFWVMAISFAIPIIFEHFKWGLTDMGTINTGRSLCFIAAFYWSSMNFIKLAEEHIAPGWQKLRGRDRTTMRAVAQLSRVGITVIVILMVLPTLGFSTGSLLAFGGVGALGVTYAGKDTLANVLGGMMIFWDRPFSVGDWIRSPDRNIEGDVEHIGWRLTRIRTFSKRPLYVPNSVFSTIIIENPSRMSHRQINMTVGVRYADAYVVDEITKGIEAMLREHPGIDAMQTTMVNFVEFAASSLNINIYAFTKTVDWGKYRVVQQDVFLKTIAIITAHGAECAFPTTTVLMPHDNSNERIDA